MTTHHFAGLNTAQFARVLEGQDVLISYADIVRRPGVWQKDILPRLQSEAYGSVILDSGAFTELTDKARNVKRAKKGLPPLPVFHCDVYAYAKFCRTYGHLFNQIVTLDDISGDLARTWKNTAVLEAAGIQAVPVFHGTEPWEVLEHYVAKYPKIGLGFARRGNTILGDQGDGLSPTEWLAECFRRIPSSVQVHGFGQTGYADLHPFATVDSTSWISEYLSVYYGDKPRGPHTCPEVRTWTREVGRDTVARLVVESYAGPVDWAPVANTDELKGQARAVFCRANELELAA